MNNGIDPKWGIALNVAYTICGLIAAGTIVFVGIPPNVVEIIKTTALDISIILGVINMALGLWSSQRPGPLVSASLPPITPTVAKVLLVAFALSFLVAGGSAQAQVKLRAPAVTGNLAKDIQTDLGNAAPTASVSLGQGGLLTPDALIKKIVSLASPDLAYSAAMATAANTNAATVRLGCIKAIQALNTQASGANLKNADGSPMVMPAEPHVFTDLETIAEGIDSLSPTGPLYTSCAGAAALAQTNVLTFINSVVTGTAAAALVVPK